MPPSIRSIRERREMDVCVDLQRSVWGTSELEITSAIDLVAFVLAGGMVHLAESVEGWPIGFACAFPAFQDGHPHFHSHMLAVLPEYRRRGLGLRLKWAQRAEALARGLDLITWTFDPMQARNANLNFRRLGAVATDLVPDLYGHTDSELHHGLPTDRLLVRWWLRSERVLAREREGDPPRTAPAPGVTLVNQVRWEGEWPVSSPPRLDLEAPDLLLELPPDWDGLCRSALALATEWQGHVRDALRAYLARGYGVNDFVPAEESGRPRPLYLLQRPPGSRS